jgi:hypothetical protein
MSPTSVFISWGPYSGINKFNVQYGYQNGNLLYNFDTNQFSTTISDLNRNQPIWVRIANRNDCFIGAYGEAKLVGGPGLPNTGSVSSKNEFKWYIPASIFGGILILLFLISGKYRFLSRR